MEVAVAIVWGEKDLQYVFVYENVNESTSGCFTCEKLEFRFLLFSLGLSFSAFFMLTVSREVEMVKFNSEVFSSGDQSFRAATTYFQERVKKANLTINIYEGANHMF